ncbi:DNA ligase [Paraburkholderia sp. BCC1886]|uniref:ATP-dependent DNA ligase n=1 Tax=Paraburkholderia sp. BCC1886 TaxID=2562670 RepID=UPI0021B40827|nr:DNA ligase [Paraburkholderia sp. BCC1886]
MADFEAADLMLAIREHRVFSRDGWLFELKYDGFRCLIRKKRERVELISRQGNSLNQSFPDMVEQVARVKGDFVWDAELTVDEATGQSSFDRLQKRARASLPRSVKVAMQNHPARLYVFDIMTAGKRDVRALPLVERKEILRDSFENTSGLVFVTGIVAAGEWVFEQVKAHDFEGMIAKRMDAPYQRGRSRDWIKLKYEHYSRPEALGFGRKLPPLPSVD